MREILFRGKCQTGEWVEGGFLNRNGKPEIVDWDKAEEGNFTFTTPVDPSTVGQFTGLTDKNGKKIFEGDIFTSDYFKNGLEFEVVFSDGSFCGKCYRTGLFPLGFTNDYYETGDDDDDFYYPEDYTSHIQIIGNIHDNPELLT